MEHLLDRILERPCLQQAQLAGSAVRGAMAHDPRTAFSGLAGWSSHPNVYVRIAAGVGYGFFATLDREAMGDVLPHLARLAADEDGEVRRHGAQAALEQLWLAHSDAMESVADEWMRGRDDSAREVLARAITSVAVGGQIRRPSVLRRFIDRGLALFDVAAPDASPELRRTLAECVNEIGCLAPELVAPMLRDWARREEVGALRLVAEIAKLPVASRAAGVDFAGAAERLRRHQTLQRVRAVRWVRQGAGTVEYPQAAAQEILVPETRTNVPWAHAADPYRGCQLRCEFCCTRSLSEWSGDDAASFVRRVSVVANAPEILARELRTDARLPRDRNVVGLGVRSDPYQPAEEEFEVVRKMLRACLDAGHPVVVQTRQALVARDLDLLEELAEQGLVNVLVALQSPVEGVRQRVEVGTSTIAERYRAIGMLARKEVPVGVLLSPVMPDLTDDPDLLDETLRRAAEAGASWAVAEPLHLRGSAGVKVRVFLDAYVGTLVPRYDELYLPDGGFTPAGEEWARHLTGDVLPAIRTRHGLDDTSRMISCGHDPASLLVRN